MTSAEESGTPGDHPDRTEDGPGSGTATRGAAAAPEHGGGTSTEEQAESSARRWGRWPLRWPIRPPEPSMPEPIAVTVTANPSGVRIPPGVDAAAAWSWRLLLIGVALGAVLFLLSYFSEIVFPLIVALLISALATPVVDRFTRLGLPRRFAALLTVVLGIAFVALLLTFVSNQVANSFTDLSRQLEDGVGQVRDWLRTGPLGLTDADIQDALGKVQDRLGSTNMVGTVTSFGTTVGHVVAGFFIVLFASYFFMADGTRIWSWAVRLFPSHARARVDGSGRVAWGSLTQFVRATMMIAATDALGIAIWAAVLRVPLVFAIAVLVFLGAFVPLVGATLSGTVAVLVALVAQGPVVAVLMLAGVVVVQQLEAHVLQPFLMGRFVSIHPLGVIVAIGLGALAAGIPGTLIAVPFAAVINAVAGYLSAGRAPVADSSEVGDLPDGSPQVDSGPISE